MDDLLTAFYQSEIPAKLEQPPSTWPEIADPQAEQPVPAHPVPARTVLTPPERGRSASRGLAVAVTTLALCLMVFVFSREAPDNGGTANNGPEPSLDNSNTATVSGSGQSGSEGTAREDDTTWNEIRDSEIPQKPDGDEKKLNAPPE